MQRAQQRNASREQKFWFRKDIYPADGVPYDPYHPTPADTRDATPVSSSPQSPSPSSPILTESPVHADRDRDGESTRVGSLDDSIPQALSSLIAEGGFKNDGHHHNHVVSVFIDEPAHSVSSGAQTPSLSEERYPPLSAAQSRCPTPAQPAFKDIRDEYEEMTMEEIVVGKVSIRPSRDRGAMRWPSDEEWITDILGLNRETASRVFWEWSMLTLTL